MAGIVVVSHSELLANGVVQLASQMTQGRCNIAAAGGVDDPENPIGTDTIKIMMAIEEVYDDSGVLVLMDMGSALLSTETALELLDPSMVDNITLCSAPIVEGTMAASVAAMSGLPMETILEETRNCLEAKQTHLGDVVETVQETPVLTLGADSLAFSWKVHNPHGLHARPTANLVGVTAGFESDIVIKRGEDQANAKSLNSIAKMGVKCCDEITFMASGNDAKDVISSITELANNHFGEDINQPAVESVKVEDKPLVKVNGALSGIPVCDGYAIGQVVRLENMMPRLPESSFTSIDNEKSIFLDALQNVVARITTNEKEAITTLGKEHAAIFMAHKALISDPEIKELVIEKIESETPAIDAFYAVMSDMANSYGQIDNEYMREREADVWDVTKQALLCFDGIEESKLEIGDNSIIVAKDLSPTETSQLDPTKVVGICLEAGGKTSHSAIIAKALGIPAVVKVTGCLSEIENEKTIIIDGGQGLVYIDFDEQFSLSIQEQREQWLADRNQDKESAHQPAITKDGQQVDIHANIGNLQDAIKAVEFGAEGVGLLRTEFIFQNSKTLPTEDEQYQIYRDIADALDGRPLTIRSLDVGGDKPLESYPMASEENPFLGLRGVRLCLTDTDLFIPQLKAVLRVAKDYPNVQLMIPMISETSELITVKALIQECREALALPESDYPMNVGIMIEVPAAVLNADALAKEADFFSIGTNDLTQYVMAADRGNTSVSNLVDYNKSAVIEAISMTCRAAKANNIPVSMCGEMAGDTDVSQLLIETGVLKLSASSSLIPSMKAKIRTLSLA
ncbi:phosphoenolpyruvate--protein phosphotransferase [Vibrio sp. SS-MA-C1-2]|uniref:phosphoenolpyruvate--protein phosphotransferase n=1 Tax=Vibrio sp. SS-MA-C1-2 TaxID=2908646 RepID=UPI001F3CBE61|nr:phosphoenolpyruvate--protein phosphotransferase [Vibrio sp. SS-MA-C1-2]UJF18424.1 phosphoenolpyruvate--protein phosphotransferase [Vibrio sp. SS-MA-C1-2]